MTRRHNPAPRLLLWTAIYTLAALAVVFVVM
jgi:hypothetical protein